jgi:hypothetical protein
VNGDGPISTPQSTQRSFGGERTARVGHSSVVAVFAAGSIGEEKITETVRAVQEDLRAVDSER